MCLFMQPLMQVPRQEVPIKLHLLFSVLSCSTFFVFDLANSCHLPVSTCNLHRKAPDQYIRTFILKILFLSSNLYKKVMTKPIKVQPYITAKGSPQQETHWTQCSNTAHVCYHV